jgi:23S rRNA (uridine2552-2'-O)-methyltransferase
MAHRKKQGDGGRTGGRMLREQVRTAAKRTPSSTRWLQRQLNDPYVVEARRQGLRSRAAFKLMQLDDRFHVLAPGRRIVDLGAAPGGWSQVAAQRVRAGTPQGGRVVGIDILDWAPIPHTVSIVRDFLDAESPRLITEALGGPADVVLSDMAAPATGHATTDHLRIVALVEVAFDFALSILAPGGSFVAKVFQGGTERELLDQMKRRFASVRHAKPAASRAESAETYVVAQGFRGAS